MSQEQIPNLFESSTPSGPVECLGLTFENDEVRRSHFLAILREKLKDPEFRKIEGFPIGEDEDILALSDPPYYTACPNPFLGDFIRCYGKPYDPETDNYIAKPYTSDISEGKGGSIYKAHTYHTKVPHEAIAKYILHYTKPGDIVLDAFSGCGMTGVAGIFCQHPSQEFKQSLKAGGFEAELGLRRTILVDLSPFATFLDHNMTFPLSKVSFESEANELIETVREELEDELYGSNSVSYLVWSQALICSDCGHEFLFADAALSDGKSIRSNFKCPGCGVETSKGKCQQKHSTFLDPFLGVPIQQKAFSPKWVAKKNNEIGLEELGEPDWEILRKIDSLDYSNSVPIVPMMFKDEPWGDMYRSGYHQGVTHVHHFWTKRNLLILSKLWDLARQSKHFNQMKFLITSFMVKTGSRMHNIGMKEGKVNLAGQIFNTLQIPSIFAERNIFELAKGKVADLSAVFGLPKERFDSIVSTSSATQLNQIPSNSVDYIFVDPPFGGNIMYSEMSFPYEAWLGVYTNSSPEAIVAKSQGKDVIAYMGKMAKAFIALYRVLKPGRWMTVEFHNSKNEVWNALQESFNSAGFVIADVRILDKKQGTFKQMTTAGAVNKDLIVSVYKPAVEFERGFDLQSGTSEAAWEFVANHLNQLPVFVSREGEAEALAERQNFMLFDRMVAFHIQRGITVPLSASEFYAGLNQRFPHRDGMYFLPEQIAEYDRKRMTVKEVLQLELFVNDESTAVQWLRQQLIKKPYTFQELQPGFLKAIGGWAKHETRLEPSDLLEQNFLCYDGGNIPKQIVSWLAKSSVHRAAIAKVLGQEPGARSQEEGEDDGQTAKLLDLVPDTGLETRDAGLLAAAKDRWYIPDPNKAGDLEKRREKALLKEFEEYRTTTAKRKVFRMEAMRAGFKHYFQQRDYKTIIQVARKVPDTVLQEDPKLLMFYDNAVTRAGEE